MKFLILVVSLVSSLAHAADFDVLGQQAVNYKAQNPAEVLSKTIGNLKGVFEKYKVQVDSSSRIVSPLKVAGTAANPTMQVGIEKCVFFVCKVVQLNAVIGIQQIQGACQHNFMLTVDLKHSVGIIKDYYDRMDAAICFNSKNQDAQVAINVNAHRAPQYEPGQVQNEIYKLLKIQIPALAEALSKTLVENGATASKRAI